MVSVMRPENIGPELQTSLTLRFGLTPAEVEIARSLVDGASVGEIAEARATSIHTVRNQVKALLAKTGAHRQIDLLRVIDTLRPTL